MMRTHYLATEDFREKHCTNPSYPPTVWMILILVSIFTNSFQH